MNLQAMVSNYFKRKSLELATGEIDRIHLELNKKGKSQMTLPLFYHFLDPLGDQRQS